VRTKREQVAEPVAGDNVYDLGRRRVEVSKEQLEDLAKEIAAQLEAGYGSVVRMSSSLENVEEWRKAARRAGRLLGVPVRTGVTDDGSKVWVVDAS
jgi:hypothetical protein